MTGPSPVPRKVLCRHACTFLQRGHAPYRKPSRVQIRLMKVYNMSVCLTLHYLRYLLPTVMLQLSDRPAPLNGD